MNLTSEQTIQHGSEVEMHFAIRLSDGSIADSTRDYGKPAKFKVGESDILDKVEQSLIGLKIGDKKKIVLTPEEGYGEANPNNLHWLPKAQFPTDIVLEEGLLISFTQPNGMEVPGIIREFNDTQALVDFNHPLCGQSLVFDLEIINISNTTN